MKQKKKPEQIIFIEKWLKNYKRYAKIIEADREFLEDKLRLTSITYDKPNIQQTNAFDSKVENQALNRISIQNRYNTMSMMKKRIDQALDILTSLEREIIELKYIEDKVWFYVARTVNISERECKRIRLDALRKMQLFLFCEVWEPELGAIQLGIKEVVQ